MVKRDVAAFGGVLLWNYRSGERRDKFRAPAFRPRLGLGDEPRELPFVSLPSDDS